MAAPLPRGIVTCFERHYCIICKNIFKNAWNLKKHVTLHVLNTEYRFICKTCDFNAPDKYTVKRHIHNRHKGIGEVVEKKLSLQQKNEISKYFYESKQYSLKQKIWNHLDRRSSGEEEEEEEEEEGNQKEFISLVTNKQTIGRKNETEEIILLSDDEKAKGNIGDRLENEDNKDKILEEIEEYSDESKIVFEDVAIEVIDLSDDSPTFKLKELQEENNFDVIQSDQTSKDISNQQLPYTKKIGCRTNDALNESNQIANIKISLSKIFTEQELYAEENNSIEDLLIEEVIEDGLDDLEENCEEEHLDDDCNHNVEDNTSNSVEEIITEDMETEVDDEPLYYQLVEEECYKESSTNQDPNQKYSKNILIKNEETEEYLIEESEDYIPESTLTDQEEFETEDRGCEVVECEKIFKSEIDSITQNIETETYSKEETLTENVYHMKQLRKKLTKEQMRKKSLNAELPNKITTKRRTQEHQHDLRQRLCILENAKVAVQYIRPLHYNKW